MTIFLAADHRGLQLKNELLAHIKEKGYIVEDLGPYEYNKEDDYPDYAYPAALGVSKDPARNRGILICGSGMGMDVAANKVKGIRATLAYSKESAEHGRANDDVNIITLSADTISRDEAKSIVDAFLETPFSGAERQVRRLKKIGEIEERNFK